ncbi:WXG100 family type VII secretion target [Streptomyces sp. NBC_01020]|uniref:WXG100 family type VII secretion target n=1 Tax=unclassified Streptomyces TaxID=2593676 RepID=UPI002E1EA556|nr:WXG100 family type VII secretion target [Streptomyces sp. NBC_01180]WSV05850.1 WXG100 family type VII secretion target [Streptomyces sp. NBC_01020]WSX68017.1 WXG100 family type VII secretion target [Streptomyces sp. NBC_00932]
MDRGADLSQLRDLAKKFQHSSGDLHTLIKHLNTATSSSTGFWKGPKADNFRSDWESVRPTFEKWVTTLGDAHKSANTSADNIEGAT